MYDWGMPSHPLQTPQVKDCIFLDPVQACAQARLRQRVEQTPSVSGLQVCYYVGDEVIGDPPENLVQVRPADFVEFMARTRYRLPTKMDFTKETVARARQLAPLSEQAAALRQKLFTEAVTAYSRRPRRQRQPNERLRVLAVTSRTTTVMQHCSRAILEAFARLGVETHLVIESSEMEAHDGTTAILSHLKFDPDLVFNINRIANQFLPSDVANVVWWQDPFQNLAREKSVRWRENDLLYSIASQLVPDLVAETGLAEGRARIQPFCIDRRRFCLDEKTVRKNKVVFVGNAAHLGLTHTAAERACLSELIHRLEAGEATSNQELISIGARYGFSANQTIHYISYFVMRDHIVRWICQTPGIDVEIYGQFWEQDPVVAPFHRGVLPHGEAVADVYRSAKYALVLHPFSINSQRLGEVGACGCIPVIYDCRFQADLPHWEDLALYFRTRQGLAECLRSDRITAPDRFAEKFDYDNFARRILQDAAPYLGPLPLEI